MNGNDLYNIYLEESAKVELKPDAWDKLTETQQSVWNTMSNYIGFAMPPNSK